MNGQAEAALPLVQSEALARRATGREKSLPRLAILCSRFYLVVAIPAVLLLCFVIAPFQGSDEPAHFLRVAAVMDFGLSPVVNLDDVHSATARPTAGGLVDDNAKALAARYPSSLLYNVHHRIHPAELRVLLETHAAGSRSYAAHSNTAIYLPLIYAVPASALAVARALDLPVLVWLYAARLAGALTGLAILYACIRRAGHLAPALLVLSLSPIMLFQLATISGDTLLLPCAVIFALLVSRISGGDRGSSFQIATLGFVSILLAAGKIAYLPLLAVPPVAARIADGRWSQRARTLAGLSGAGVVTWLLWAYVISGKIFAIRPASERVDVPAQVATMIAHPLAALHTLLFAIVSHLPNMAVQLLGSRVSWYEVMISPILVIPGLAVLLLAATTWSSGRPARKAIFWFSALMAAACYGLVYLAVYLQNNPVGATTVGGIQGRYFFPLAALLLALAPRIPRLASFENRVLPIVFTWCAISPVVTLATLASRYWAI